MSMKIIHLLLAYLASICVSVQVRLKNHLDKDYTGEVSPVILKLVSFVKTS